jgi:hypothetical protein
MATFGNGAKSSLDFNENAVQLTLVQANNEAGTITSLFIQAFAGTTSSKLIPVVYSDSYSGGVHTANALLGVGDEITTSDWQTGDWNNRPSPVDWHELTGLSVAFAANQYLWIGFIVASYDIYMCCDVAGDGTLWFGYLPQSSYPTPPATFAGGSYYDEPQAFYAQYTPAGGTGQQLFALINEMRY